MLLATSGKSMGCFARKYGAVFGKCQRAIGKDESDETTKTNSRYAGPPRLVSAGLSNISCGGIRHDMEGNTE